MPRTIKLVAFAFAFFLGALSPAAAAAQSAGDTVTVSSLGQPTTTNTTESHAWVGSVGGFVGTRDRRWGQEFTTGGNAQDRFNLHSITLDGFGAPVGNPGDLEVRLHESSGGNPGPVGVTLSGPARPGAGHHAYSYTTSAGGPFVLRGATNYMVVLRDTDPKVAPSGGDLYRFRVTGSDAEDSGATSGWSISNVARRWTVQHEQSWGNWGDALRIAVRATVAAGPSVITISDTRNTTQTIGDGITLIVTSTGVVNAPNGGQAVKAGSQNVVRNSGAIKGPTGGANDIHALDFSGNFNTLTNESGATIATTLAGHFGALFTGNDNVVTNAGAITTAEWNGRGINTVGSRNRVTVEAGGSITTSHNGGHRAAAIRQEGGSGNAAINRGTLTTAATHFDAGGIRQFGGGNIAINSGTITTTGREAHAMSAVDNGNFLMNSGTITSGGHAIEAFGDNNTITMTAGKVTGGNGFAGVQISDDGGDSSGNNNTITISGGVVEGTGGNGDGIRIDGDNNDISITAATVTISGARYGIYTDGAADNNTITIAGRVEGGTNSIRVDGTGNTIVLESTATLSGPLGIAGGNTIIDRRAAPAGVLYMVGGTNDALYALNTTTGAATRIGNATAFGVGETNPSGLAAIGNTLYMVGIQTEKLYTLNTGTGVATQVGSAKVGADEFNPSGLAAIGNTLYMVGTDNDALYTINTGTGAATRVGSATAFGVGELFPGALASIGSTMYMTGFQNGALYTVNTGNSTAARVGTATDFGVSESDPAGLAALGTRLYMAGNGTNALYTLNTATGAAARVGASTAFGVGETVPSGLAFVEGAAPPAPLMPGDAASVSNLAESRISSSFVGIRSGTVRERAQLFTTGGGAGERFALQNVTFRINGSAGTSAQRGPLQVTINAVAGANPGAVLATLGGTTPTGTATTSTYSAPAGGVTLNGGTAYFVVWRAPNADAAAGNAYFLLDNTNSNAEAASAGWSIADTSRVGTGGSWTSNSNNPVQMRVRATVAAAPCAGAAVCVSNLGRTSPGNLSVGNLTSGLNRAAQPFTTGGTTAESFMLTDVTVAIAGANNNSSDFRISIHEADSTTPADPATVVLAALTGTARPSAVGQYTYAPMGNVVLRGATTYFVVVDTAAGSGFYSLRRSNLTLDSGSGTGWSINDAFRLAPPAWRSFFTGSVMSLRIRAAVAPAAPPPAPAVGDAVTVSNLGQAVRSGVPYFIGGDYAVAQRFTTGASAGDGFVLSDASIRLDNKVGNPGPLAVYLHAADSANPQIPAATPLATLTGPEPTGGGTWVFTPSSAAALASNGNYFVVFATPSSASRGNNYRAYLTLSDAEDSNTSNGWSFADTYYQRSGSGAWTASISSSSLLVRVRAAVAPATPPAPCAAGTLCVSNTGQQSATGTPTIIGRSSVAAYNLWAQQFTTGAGQATLLRDVSFRLSQIHGSPGDLTVQIHGALGTPVATLTGPARPSSARNYTYSAPADNVTLAAGANYHVVFLTPNVANSGYQIDWTSVSAEDANSAGGWSISDDASFTVQASGAGGWQNTSGALKLRIHAAAAAPPPDYCAGQSHCISNLGRPNATGSATIIGGGEVWGQAFTAGQKSLLRDVTIQLENVQGNPQNLTVELHRPIGTPVATLTGPARPSGAGNYTYTAPENTVLADGTYQVVFLTPNVSGSDGYQIAWTAGAAEDAGGSNGWSIANQQYFSNQVSGGGPWTKTSSGSIKIRIRAAAAPPAPACAGAAFCVSNLRQAVGPTFSAGAVSNNRPAQAFTLGGTNSDRYSLADVTVILQSTAGNPDDLQVSIHAPDSTTPANPAATALAVLQGPARPRPPNARTEYTYTAPADGLLLTGGATYFVQLDIPTNAGARKIYVADGSNADAEDAGGASGWTIANEGRQNISGSWNSGLGTSLKIRVRANAAAAPPTGPCAGAAFCVSTLRQAPSSSVLSAGRLAGGPSSVAQAFTSGGSAADSYLLRDVTFSIPFLNGTAAQRGDLLVTLHSPDSANRNLPDTTAALATFTGATPTAAGEFTFAAPAGTTIAGATSYFIVWRAPNVNTSVSRAGFPLDFTAANGEDAGAAAGWSIADSSAQNPGTWARFGETVQIRVRAAAEPPPPPLVISAPADQTFIAGTAITDITLDAAAGGDGNYTYTLTNLPDGLSFNAGTRVLSGTPSRAAAAATVTYGVSDGASAAASAIFQITIAAPAMPCAGAALCVSNLGQTRDESSLTTGRSEFGGSVSYFTAAQGFSTGGGSADRFALRDVGVVIYKTNGTPDDITIALHAASSANPQNPAAAAIATLTGPARPRAVNVTTPTLFTPAESIVLAGNNTYFIVITTPNKTGGDNNYALDLTGVGEDAGTSSGWSIADGYRYTEDGGAWQSFGNNAVRMRVRAEAAQPNRAPVAGGTIPAQNLILGDAPVTVALAGVFTDADAGDVLTYSAISSAPLVAAVTVSNGGVIVRALATGSAVVTVMAADPDGASASVTFNVQVSVAPMDALGRLRLRAAQAEAALDAARTRLAELQMERAAAQTRLVTVNADLATVQMQLDIVNADLVAARAAGTPERVAAAVAAQVQMRLIENIDLNRDGVIDADDFLIMYYAAANAAELGDGVSGGTAAARARMLAGLRGALPATDATYQLLLRRANALGAL